MLSILKQTNDEEPISLRSCSRLLLTNNNSLQKNEEVRMLSDAHREFNLLGLIKTNSNYIKTFALSLICKFKFATYSNEQHGY